MTEPTLTQRTAATCVAGLAAWTNNAAEAQPTTAQIPHLWDRFTREHWFERLERSGAVGSPAAVYTDYRTDVAGEYRIVVGREVPCGAEPVPGLHSISIPAGRYLIFQFHGSMPRVVIDGWHQVWSYFQQPGTLRRAYTADLEMYRADGTGVAICIAVK
jgi:predicted transcriptional regulator YdeE